MATPKPMTRQEYETKREWIVDTAETPEDKKRLKAELAKLDAAFKAQQQAKQAPKSRSNQPRTGSSLSNSNDYHSAVEVAGQPENTPKEKAVRKRAEAEERDYERRFPNASERKGTQANHAVTKVDRKTGKAK